MCHFIAALRSPAGKGLISWLSFVMLSCVFVTFPCGILGQVWYLIVLIPDLCHLSYFTKSQTSKTFFVRANVGRNATILVFQDKSPQLQRLARKLKYRYGKSRYDAFEKVNTKCAGGRGECTS